MAQRKKRGWASHFAITKDYPPSPLLIRAMPYVKKGGKALDMGAGALKDSKYLLEKGFDVTAVDAEPLVAKMASSILSDKLHVTISSFEKFAFPKNTFDLISSMFSLPFTRPKEFEKVFESLVESLKDDGIFCGQFFGVKDSWHTDTTMTFHDKEHIEKLLSPFKILTLDEEERESKTTNGVLKHWHIFHVIAQKKTRSRHRKSR